jgi:hypothetical protein
MQAVIESATSKNITATGDVTTRNTALMGFYVNSTSGGTLVLRKGGSGGTALGGTITPAAGYHPYPCGCHGGLHATISGTIDLTFFYEEAA